jgi:hypothetical protein
MTLGTFSWWDFTGGIQNHLAIPQYKFLLLLGLIGATELEAAGSVTQVNLCNA